MLRNIVIETGIDETVAKANSLADVEGIPLPPAQPQNRFHYLGTHSESASKQIIDILRCLNAYIVILCISYNCCNEG